MRALSRHLGIAQARRKTSLDHQLAILGNDTKSTPAEQKPTKA